VKVLGKRKSPTRLPSQVVKRMDQRCKIRSC
jgi:hypothetical protein